MDALVLTISPRPAGGHAVVPRRLGLDLVPGKGALHWPDAPALDETARASFSNAWEAAKRLAVRHDLDARLSLAGRTPLSGASAGLTAGLLALAGLQAETLAPFFATGGVADPTGRLEGGLVAQEKARAAAELAPQLGLREPWFLCPPVARVPEAPPLRVACVADLAAAYARVSS